MRRISTSARRSASVAATGGGADPDGGPDLPAGEVHGWWHGQAETVCGLQLRRSGLRSFPALLWPDVDPDSGGSADLVQVVCARCRTALSTTGRSGWRRTDPRP